MSASRHDSGDGNPELPAFWISTEPQGESDALVRLFTWPDGALNTRARGLLKPQARLAGQLKSADELVVSVAGRTRTPVLTGVRLTRSNPFWREELGRQSLAWFMLECAYIGSGPPQLNQSVFQLLTNLLRLSPKHSQLPAIAGAYCLRMLTVHGLLPDLDHDAVDGIALPAGEPVFLLPSGEGVIGREHYNRRYARTGAGLIRLDPLRRRRWRDLLMLPLEAVLTVEADEIDAALTISELGRRIADSGNQPVRTMDFLRRQWKLPRRGDISRSTL